MKIVVIGIGGVGGYYGGLLARRFEGASKVEIYFLARGAHLQKMQQDGLMVITESERFITHPTLATDDVNEIGKVDYILLCTKSYDLEASVLQIKSLIGPNTVILPLLNGVDITTRIQKILPSTEVWSGLSYIVARLNEPGVVESSGDLHALYFGYNNQTNERLLEFEALLQSAGIEATFSENILLLIWIKFMFISTTATLTSFFDVNFNALVTDEVRKQTLIVLSKELILIARAEGVELSFDLIDKTIHRLEKIPVHATTSMHSDFSKARDTELESLTGIVIQMAHKHGIAVPVYQRVYAELKNRLNSRSLRS
jgi:2-dehydropantoate 2-reductase